MSAEKQTVGIGNTYWILFFVLSLSVGDMTILEDIEAKTDFFVASLMPGTVVVCCWYMYLVTYQYQLDICYCALAYTCMTNA